MTIQEILEKVTTELVIDIMEECGSPVCSKGTTSDGASYLVFLTMCHHSDPEEASPKLYYYTESKNFMCYTNCGHMSFFDGIMKIKGLNSFRDVLVYLGDKMDIDIFDHSSKRIVTALEKEFETLNEDYIKEVKVSQDEPVSDSVEDIKEEKYFDDPEDWRLLDYFENRPYLGWVQEGISPETMEKFEIKWDGIMSRVIIPHFILNDKGEKKIVGIKRRSLTKEDLIEAKYKPITFNGKLYAHNVRKMFYGLYLNQPAIEKSKEAIIVEAEKSVLLSDTYFGDNSTTIAVNGFNIFPWHIKKLEDLKVEDIYLAFDKDVNLKIDRSPQADQYINKICDMINKLQKISRVWVIYDVYNKLDLKDSPFDKGKDTFLYLKNKAENGEEFIKKWKKN